MNGCAVGRESHPSSRICPKYASRTFCTLVRTYTSRRGHFYHLGSERTDDLRRVTLRLKVAHYVCQTSLKPFKYQVYHIHVNGVSRRKLHERSERSRPTRSTRWDDIYKKGRGLRDNRPRARGFPRPAGHAEFWLPFHSTVTMLGQIYSNYYTLAAESHSAARAALTDGDTPASLPTPLLAKFVSRVVCA